MDSEKEHNNDSSLLHSEVLRNIGEISNLPLSLKKRLASITDITANALHIDSCSILTLDDESNDMVLRATTGLKKKSILQVRLKPGEGVVGWCAQKKKAVILEEAIKDERFKYIPLTGEERFTSLIAMPIIFNQRCIGVLLLNSVKRRRFSTDEVNTVRTISHFISGIINATTLYEKQQKTLQETTTFYHYVTEISRLITKKAIEKTLVHSLKELTSAEIVALWYRKKNNNLELLSARTQGGVSFIRELSPQKVKEIAHKTGMALLLFNEERKEEKEALFEILFEKKPEIDHMIFSPLIHDGQFDGIVLLANKRVLNSSVPFHNQDLWKASTIISQTSVVLKNAHLYAKLKELRKSDKAKVNELAQLLELSKVMQSSLDQETVLKMTLLFLTIPNFGLGYERAIIFLMNSEQNELIGKIGISPDSRKQLAEWSEQYKQCTVKNFRTLFEEGELSFCFQNTFAEKVRSLHISVNDENAYNEVYKTKKPKIVADYQQYCPICEKHDFIHSSCFLVPIVVQDEVLGILFIDNLYSEKEIKRSDTESLLRLAAHAGNAIKNSQLFTILNQKNHELQEKEFALIESEKDSAIGRLATDLAHEIKNPILSIGGFAKRLDAKLAGNAELQKYSGIIISETARLEELVKNTLSFMKDQSVNLQSVEITSLLNERIHHYQKNNQLQHLRFISLLNEHITIVTDPNKLLQIFNNIIENAIDACSTVASGKITVSCIILKKKQKVQLIITDNGGGAPPATLSKLTNPYFTTKKHGTGLGLFISQKNVTSLKGSLFFENEGEGFKVSISLPYEETTS